MTSFNRSESRQRALIDAAERLVNEHRARQQRIASSTINQHHALQAEPRPSADQVQAGLLVRELQKRLAERDRGLQ